VQRRLDEHPEKMRQRRETVEHPFGTIKARMGTTRFLVKMLRSGQESATAIARAARPSARLAEPSPYKKSSRNCTCGDCVVVDGVSELNDTLSKGDHDGVSPVERPELLDGGADVPIDGSLGDMENFADLPGRLALRHPCQNFTLTQRY
jgi:hypothetical protein